MTKPVQSWEETLKEAATMQKKMLEGLLNILHSEKDITPSVTEGELVYQEDKVKLIHYESTAANKCPVPLVVSYALVNRQYMMDIQEDRSMIRKLMDLGIDLYVIDWGYPTPIDRYLTMEDYILGYLDNVIEFTMERCGVPSVNLMGVCQGGTFSSIYTAVHPQKIKNLITMVAPFDFQSKDGLLNVWSDAIDVDLMVDVMGNIPGPFMNLGFLWLKPFQLIVDKYVGLFDNLDKPAVVNNFMRMERWIFDSPDQAGEAFRKFVKDMYQENKLYKGTFDLGGAVVDMKNITMPVFNIYGELDHLVPPDCSKPLSKMVGSKDVTTKGFDLGHIGMYVSSRSQKELAPAIADWLIERCETGKGSGKAAAKSAKKK